VKKTEIAPKKLDEHTTTAENLQHYLTYRKWHLLRIAAGSFLVCDSASTTEKRRVDLSNETGGIPEAR
jgi:hypothetical protein